jgi:peptide/nickel transport system permease protein
MTTAVATPDLVQSQAKPRASGLTRLGRLARRNPVGAAAGVVCILLIVIAIFAPVIAPYAADKVGFPRLQAPSPEHPFGTDNLFRDIFSRIVIGSRISLGVGFAAVATGTIFGVFFGLVSGYIGGWVDLLVNRGMDTIMAFPPLVLAIFFLSIFSPTFLTVSLAIAIIITPATARIVRGSVLSIRNQQYVEAAVALGGSHGRIMGRHVLPNVVAPIIVIASIQIGNAILAEAALSFLSLGIATDSHPSWGKMLQDTRQVWQAAWWTAVIPGAAISVAVLAFNLFGDALRDVLDPRLRGS